MQRLKDRWCWADTGLAPRQIPKCWTIPRWTASREALVERDSSVDLTRLKHLFLLLIQLPRNPALADGIAALITRHLPAHEGTR
jgi:hypothetical protein